MTAYRNGHAPVDLADALDRIEAFLRRYVVFPLNAQPAAVALWVVATYVAEQAETLAYLAVTSAEKRSGKTRLLDCLELLARKPWRAVLPSEAVVYRMIEAEGPTLLLDEVDAIFGSRAADKHEGLRALLNAGTRAGTTVPRMVGEGRKMTIHHFAVYCPKALAGIGRLPDTVSDRSIPIRLERRARSERVERFRHREARKLAEPIRAGIEAQVAQLDIARAEPDLPASLDDRAADGWEALLAIADHAGGAWPLRARRAAVNLSADRDDEESLGHSLLVDCRVIFREHGDTDYLQTADLLADLTDLVESPWGELNKGRPITPHGVARLLKAYGIHPIQKKVDGLKTRGYLREAFVSPWGRYLVKQPAGTTGAEAVPRDPEHDAGTGGPLAEQGARIEDDYPRSAWDAAA